MGDTTMYAHRTDPRPVERVRLAAEKIKAKLSPEVVAEFHNNVIKRLNERFGRM